MSQQTRTMNRQQSESLVDAVEWQWAAAYGVGAWLVSLVASYATLTVAGAKEFPDSSLLEMAAWMVHVSSGGQIVAEGPGAGFGSGPGFAPTTGGIQAVIYATVDSDFFAVAIAPHFLATAIATVVAGYLLAKRHAPDGGHAAFSGRVRSLAGGASLTVGFALATIVGMVMFDPSGISYETDRLLVAAFAYPLVFGSAGAAMGSGISTRSFVAFAAGLGSFVLGSLLFKFLGDVPKIVPSASMPGDFGPDFGLVGDTAFAFFYVQDHGVAEFLPAWPAIVALLVAGGVVAYVASPSSPLVGAGKGARIAWGYAPLAFLTLAAWIGGFMNELRTSDFFSMDEQALIDLTNVFYGGALPEGTLLAGIVWPVLLGGVGGAVVTYARAEL